MLGFFSRLRTLILMNDKGVIMMIQTCIIPISIFIRKLSLFIFLTLLVLPTVSFAITPIAHNNVVPYQRIEYGKTFNFGVVTFSKPGINRVDFNISGQGYSGGVKTSSTMALNTRVASALYDGVWEYWVSINSSEFNGNGPITVSPTVYDNDNNTRVLETITLIVEGASAGFNRISSWVDTENGNDRTGKVGNSFYPYKTIQVAVTAAQSANGGDSSGNIIYLEEGTYSIAGLSASTSGEWLTITKSSTANRNNVIINDGQTTSSISAQALKFDNITFQSQGSSQEVLVGGNSPYKFWTNSCRRIGSGRHTSRSNPVRMNHQSVPVNDAYYSTDDYTYDVDYAYNSVKLIRGAVVSTVGDDVFENYQCVINAQVDDVSNGATTAHSDILQVYQNNSGTIPVQNRLAYNVYATNVRCQGVMRSSNHQGARDNAFINVFIEMREPFDETEGGKVTGGAIKSECGEDHLLMWHCSIPYAPTKIYQTLTDSSLIGNLFWQFRYIEDLGDPNISFFQKGNSEGNEALNNHFMHVYGATGSCTPCENDDARNYPCPMWYAKRPDSGASLTATTGDGVVDISTPGADNFGYPLEDSDLVDALSKIYVPCDALGNVRDASSDIGALEYRSVNSSTIQRPTGFKIVTNQ